MIVGHRNVIAQLEQRSAAGVLPHAILLYGPSGVGKRTLALGLAHFLERNVFDVPVNSVLHDMHLVEPVDGTISIDTVRSLHTLLWQRPVVSTRKTIILHRASCLNDAAQDALLKLTEEPPSTALIVATVEDLAMLHPTLVSRMHTLYCHSVAADVIVSWLVKEYAVSPTQSREASALSGGRPGVAWRLCRDEAFQELKKNAQLLRETEGSLRRAHIKTLVARDDFQLQPFLDMLILLTAPEAKHRYVFWHELLNVRAKAATLNVNPRLQLEGLFLRYTP